MNKIILWDADGVMTVPEEFFSDVYAAHYGLDTKPFETFFKTEWSDFVTGKRDLKDYLTNDPNPFNYEGSPDELLRWWFESEDLRNNEMIALVQRLRSDGIPCFLATEQEKHRGEYMRTVMFPDLFDGFFVTAELGIKKSNPDFFRRIIERLQVDQPAITPADIIFFDDSQSKVDSALEAGLDAHLFTGYTACLEALDGSGVKL